MLTDSHAHLTSPILASDLDGLIKRASNSGVGAMINICTNPEELLSGIDLSKKFPWIYQAAATTPHDAAEEGEAHFDAIAEKAREGFLVAVGETGLDYHYYQETAEIQKQIFIRYLQLAKECGLPVVIHCREAFDDFFTIIDRYYKNSPGVLHCFTGTHGDAMQLLERGWHISLSGIITYKKSLELQGIARDIPLDRLLIETDSPYLAPQSKRGKTNEPAFLKETAQCLAHLKGISEADLAKATSSNACRLFNITPSKPIF